jgi:EmrB/QacA subfamily drug resistance transporter
MIRPERTPRVPLSAAQRSTVIGAALLALFLGALDALVMSAAMPTIVAELGGLTLYSWVYSAYFLARAVSLPIFGKLADLFKNRNLFLGAILLFMLSSAAAGCAPDMVVLIAARVFQGVGAGGIFALVYIVLADVSDSANRGRTLSMASSIWGIASVLGPTLGGFIVTYFSWRWIFFINLPLGAFCLWGIGTYLVELRPPKREVSLDLLGVATLSTAVLAFLFAFLLGGRSYPWLSLPITGLMILFVLGTVLFIRVEQRARDPLLPIAMFRRRGFSAGNAAVFLSSFAIFSMFAYAPLFIQGVQGKSPLQVGLAMLSLSLGWSLGSLALGQVVDRLGHKSAAVSGALCLLAGCSMALGFQPETSVRYSFTCFLVIGIGMGFVALATLLAVQSAGGRRDLGVATASNQFARTLGGAVGVGIGGSFIATRFAELSHTLRSGGHLPQLPAHLVEGGLDQVEGLLRPEVLSALPASLRLAVQESVRSGVAAVFWTVLVAALLCLACCAAIPGQGRPEKRKTF